MEDVNGTLIFKNVSEMDRGQYLCRASNDQGEISATVVVTPVIAPKFLVKPQGPIQVNEMGSVMIHCAATGNTKQKNNINNTMQLASQPVKLIESLLFK